MPNLKIRSVSEVGLVRDAPAADAPPNAWTTANNVRYLNGHVEPSGVFKNFGLPIYLLENTPIHIAPFQINRSEGLPGDGDNDLLVVDRGNGIWKYNASTRYLRDFSVDVATYTDWPVALNNEKVYSLLVGGAAVVLSAAFWPVGILPGSSRAVPLMTAHATWAKSKWQCGVVWKDRLIVANGTDALGNRYPFRVFWSGPTQTGDLPTDWAAESTASTAGWVDLTGLDSEILDMAVLGDAIYVFSRSGIIRIVESGDSSIVATSQVTQDDGVLTSGCAVTVPFVGLFVVGSHSIYLFDGYSRNPVAEGTVEKWFRRTIDGASTKKLSVYVDHKRSEVWVAFVSLDGTAKWKSTPYANQALVWNYSSRGHPWSTRDLPNVACMTTAYHTPDPTTWATFGEPGVLTGDVYVRDVAGWLDRLVSPTRLFRGLIEPDVVNGVPNLVGRAFTLTYGGVTTNHTVVSMDPDGIDPVSGHDLKFTPALTSPLPLYNTTYTFSMTFTAEEYRAMLLTWATSGGTWAEAVSQNRAFSLFLSTVSTSHWLEPLVLAYEDIGEGAMLSEAVRNADGSTLEHIGADGDSLGMPISAIQYFSEFVPQGATLSGESFTVSLGGSMDPETGYKWTPPYTFVSGTDRWVNGRVTGRYIGWRLTTTGQNRLRLSGADITVAPLAQR